MEKLPIKITLPDSFFNPEEKCGYQVTHESKMLWAVILDLMVEFDRVCKQYQIKYCLDSGSLLGAVRHGGFIPWDNDADVIMLRSEYERLCHIASKAFEHPYFWQTNDTDPGTMRRHGQLRNSMTTGILMDETKNGIPSFGFNQGIFLDIFVLDEVPDDTEELTRFREALDHQLVQLWDFKEYYWASGASPWIRAAQKQAYAEFESLASSYNGTGQKYVANITLKPHRPKSAFFPKNLYEDLTDYKFEGFSFPGPKDYEIILQGHYGDWHQYVIGGDAHGSMIVDSNHPYTEYLKEISEQQDEEEHPILHLYRDRYTLLVQRDLAWKDIKQYQELQHESSLEIEQCKLDISNLTNQLNSDTTLFEQQKKSFLKRIHILTSFVVVFGLVIILMLILYITCG